MSTPHLRRFTLAELDAAPHPELSGLKGSLRYYRRFRCFLFVLDVEEVIKPARPMKRWYLLEDGSVSSDIDWQAEKAVTERLLGDLRFYPVDPVVIRVNVDGLAVPGLVANRARHPTPPRPSGLVLRRTSFPQPFHVRRSGIRRAP